MIEMLLSLAIFAVVTAFVTANFRAGRQSDELRIGSQLLLTGVRRAQTMALAGQTVPSCQGGSNDLKVCPNSTAGECPGGTCIRAVPKGYGVRLTTASPANQKIVVFADIDGDRAFDVGEALRTDSIAPGPFVVIDSLNPVAAGVLDMVFEPPKPKLWYNGSDGQPVATVVIRHTTTGKTKNVTVNAISGQISSD